MNLFDHKIKPIEQIRHADVFVRGAWYFGLRRKDKIVILTHDNFGQGHEVSLPIDEVGLYRYTYNDDGTFNDPDHRAMDCPEADQLFYLGDQVFKDFFNKQPHTTQEAIDFAKKRLAEYVKSDEYKGAVEKSRNEYLQSELEVLINEYGREKVVDILKIIPLSN